MTNVSSSMKKKILFFSFLITGYLCAQNIPAKNIVNNFFEIGWRAGLNLTFPENFKSISNPYSSTNEVKKAIDGFTLGLYTQFKFSALYVRPEVLFSKYNSTYESLTVGKSRLEAPISLGLKLIPLLSLFAGPTYRLDLEDTTQGFTLENSKENSTLGIHFGTRIHLGKLGVEARIERGISDRISKLITTNNLLIGTIDNRQSIACSGISYSF